MIHAQRALLQRMDELHRQKHSGQPDLDARIANYELAARMQITATDALNLSQESEETKEMYGLNQELTASYGKRCLMARRLVERGVRFVQIFIESQIWDAHSDLENSLRYSCGKTDQPIAALLKDLKQRGLLDSTLVIWGSEFGRLPMSQSGNGRDHNPHGFTMWFAGGGVKGGRVVGDTDEFGLRGVGDRYHMRDFHATILQLLGLDQNRLWY